MIREMKRLGFTKLDHSPHRHIFVNQKDMIKVIDHVNAYDRKGPIPKKMLKVMRKLGLMKTFMGQVKELDDVLYSEWKRTGI